MKLYVLPVEKVCNAACPFCITDFRNMANQELLKEKDLKKILEKLSFEKIEITGGGEPLLNPSINSIVSKCINNAPTHIYTNGILLGGKSQLLKGIHHITISRAHYDDQKNKEIMKLSKNYNWKETVENLNIPLKISLLLLKSGIHNVKEFINYLSWLEDFPIKEVVVRQLFEEENKNYQSYYKKEYVSTEKVFLEFIKHIGTKETYYKKGNPCVKYKDFNIEFELRSCACEMDDPVLHANGILNNGWSEEDYDIDGR